MLVQQADSMKSSIEAALGKDNVVIDKNCSRTMQITLRTFAQSTSKKTLIWDITGWGPDFQDPSTYLISWTQQMNFDWKRDSGSQERPSVIEKIGLNQYKELLMPPMLKIDTNASLMKNTLLPALATENAMVLPITLVAEFHPSRRWYRAVGKLCNWY